MAIALLALIVALCALALAYLAYRKADGLLKDEKYRHDNCGEQPDSLRTLVVSIANSVFEGKKKSLQTQPLDTAKLSEEIETKVYSKLSDRLLAVLAERQPKQPEEEPASEKKAEVPQSPCVEFLSPYDEANNRFSRNQPYTFDTAVFKLTIDGSDPDKGTFELNPEKMAVILGCRDYLNGACDCEGDGSAVTTVKQGVARRAGDHWVMEEPLRVKFF